MPRYEGPSPANLAIAEKARAQAAAKARAAQISRNIGNTYGGALSRYKPPEKEQELIGIQDAVLYWASESGIDNSTDDAGNSGLHKTVFDTTTYADQAQIKLLNDSGSTQYVRAVAIKGKPVIRESNKTHDSFVDHQDIFYNGENTFEFGNGYVVTKDQLENLADYYAKALGALQGNAASPKNKHIYVLSIPGRNWHFEPGEWVVVQMGAAGGKEYIDSVCEIYNVSVESAAGDLGTTVVSLREVEQNWVKDSNAVARYLATGDPKWRPNNFGRVVVAARDYLGVADYYCDGTADQTEIQAAIDYLAGTFNGGYIELTEGTFNISAAIELANNIILMGKGVKTILEKNCDDNLLEIIGSEGDEKEDIYVVRMTLSRNSSDTYASKYFLSLDYAKQITIEDILLNDPYSYGIRLNHVDFISVNRLQMDEGNSWALYALVNASHINVTNAKLYNSKYGIAIGGDYCIVSNSNIANMDFSGVWIAGQKCIVNGNQITNCAQMSQTSAGILIYPAAGTTAINNQIANNYCEDNGTLIVYGNCEGDPIEPYIDGDTNSKSNCTSSFSTGKYYAGTKSILITKTSTSTAEYRFCDNINKNDLHGLVANRQYALSAYTYIMATGSPQTTEVSLVIGYTTSSGGAWHEITAEPSTGKDAWYICQTTNVAIPVGAKGAKALIRIAAPSSTGEAIYIDNVRLKPVGLFNDFQENYYDTGENTYALGNSWQSPAATT